MHSRRVYHLEIRCIHRLNSTERIAMMMHRSPGQAVIRRGEGRVAPARITLKRSTEKCRGCCYFVELNGDAFGLVRPDFPQRSLQ
jgi:hypothetical protein